MRRVLVTRPCGQAASLQAALRAQGLEPVAVPAIAVEIDPPGGDLDRVARVLETFDWVVVTSANGARAVLAAAERVATALSAPRWAAIGSGTADVLEREGVHVDFRPTRSDARAIGDELPIAAGDAVLNLRGDLADDELRTRLEERGAVVEDVVAYRTIEAPASSRQRLQEAFAMGYPDAVVFASGSAARGLVSLARFERLHVTGIPAVCIGPQTEREALRLGFRVLATSAQPDPSTLATTTARALAQSMERP